MCCKFTTQLVQLKQHMLLLFTYSLYNCILYNILFSEWHCIYLYDQTPVCYKDNILIFYIKHRMCPRLHIISILAHISAFSNISILGIILTATSYFLSNCAISHKTLGVVLPYLDMGRRCCGDDPCF